MKFIVSAGGQGTKLWPYSRENNPKQFQKILNGESLFSYNVKTLLRKYPPTDVLISTKERYLKIAREQVPQIPNENYIIEPDSPKNRGPADGLATVFLDIKYPGEPFMIVQSDCVRIPESNYLLLIETAEKLVKEHKKFISGGIAVMYPDLGVDYLKLGRKIHSYGNVDVYEATEYIDRPSSYAETKELIENFNVVKHSNHNCWYPQMLLEAYAHYKPDWHKALVEIKKILSETNSFEGIAQIYQAMEAGATEIVTKHIFKDALILQLNYNWVDIGTWNSLYEYFARKDQVYKEGNVIAMDSKSSLIKSDNPEKLIAVFGLKDMVVVDTADTLLIVPKDKTDRIKDIQEELRNKKLNKYL